LTGLWRQFNTAHGGVLLLSIALQLGLATIFGQAYGMRIFFATGHLVAAGQSPYAARDLTAVFNNSSFQDMTSIGYPPPWPLVLGLIYQASYRVMPNLPVYNLAIKLPTILANIGLAYLVAGVLRQYGSEHALVRRAWKYLLLSPFVLYFTSAWGQFDSVVTLLSLSSLLLLHNRRLVGSAIVLALAVSLKPTALPIMPVAVLYLFWGAGQAVSLPGASPNLDSPNDIGQAISQPASGRTDLLISALRQPAIYTLAFITGIILFCIAPFSLFDWDASPILRGWNAHFTVGGGMSFMTFLELLKDTYQLPGWWWLLGLAWLPALMLGMLALRHPVTGFVDLLKQATGMLMIYFLTRAWLSEPNLMLILPFVLILTSLGELDNLALVAVSFLPLAFTILNTSPPQLLFPSFPGLMNDLLARMDDFRSARLVARALSVIPWQVAGWWIVFTCFQSRPTHSRQPGLSVSRV
jgi:hypothetical protein